MSRSQEKLVNHCGGRSPNALLQIEVQFEHLHFCLDILWKFGHALLKELLAMCKTVSGLVCISITHIFKFAVSHTPFFGPVGQEVGMWN